MLYHTVIAMKREMLETALQYMQTAFDTSGRSKGQRGGIDSLVPAAISIVILSLVLGAGGLILGGMQDSVTDNSTADNLIQDGVSGLQELGGFLPTVVVVIVAGLLIALVVGLRRFQGAGGATGA